MSSTPTPARSNAPPTRSAKQILDDCDRALEYLLEANRDWLTTNTNLEGAIRWHRFDQMSVKPLAALVFRNGPLQRSTPTTTFRVGRTRRNTPPK